MRLTASWGEVGVRRGSSRWEFASFLQGEATRKEGDTFGSNPGLLGRAGQGMPGAGGKMQGNTLDSQGGVKDSGHAW